MVAQHPREGQVSKTGTVYRVKRFIVVYRLADGRLYQCSTLGAYNTERKAEALKADGASLVAIKEA